MKYQRKQRTPNPRPPIERPGVLPPAVIVPADLACRFPSVWRIGGNDGAKVGRGEAWVFDVLLKYRGPQHNFDLATTWCIECPGHANNQDQAIKLLRERARDLGYCKIEIFDIRPPMTPEKRAYIQHVNQAIKRPGYRLGKVAI